MGPVLGAAKVSNENLKRAWPIRSKKPRPVWKSCKLTNRRSSTCAAKKLAVVESVAIAVGTMTPAPTARPDQAREQLREKGIGIDVTPTCKRIAAR